MRVVSAHVENGVGMAYASGSAAWVYDLDLLHKARARQQRTIHPNSG